MTQHILRVLTPTLAIFVLASGSAHATADARCGTVAFAPESDDGAFQIVARNTSCGVARVVADASRPNRFRTGSHRYAARGFACAGRAEELGGAGKHVVSFQCTRGVSAVSFLRG